MRATWKLAGYLSLLVVLMAGRASAQSSSAWTDIMDNKRLLACVFPAYQPYSWKDASGTWLGFSADMARDVARTLRVEPIFVESSIKTVVLDLQSGKCQVYFGFNATPERALAIDFAGPLYTFGFLFATRQGWTAPSNRWADFNNPETRMCYTVGNSAEQQIKRLAPKSTQIALPDSSDCVLALLSKRADVYVDGVMGVLGAAQKDGHFGEVIAPVPSFALPSYAGVRLDSDGRIQKFLQRWVEYNRANGNIRAWLLSNMQRAGIAANLIPPDLQF